ncbi:hypothetical protein AAZX31_17G112800 [Glycine max]|nr:F-box/kelch-repeat protein At3g23880 [Glycine max]XP_028210704.1 F-box/kelch-repeat protein At3g23880-like [Glycine soja]KAG4378866.1 hypothetical protein GLYMA_17G116300v4 [Glycine max]KAH1201945.1 F-box/kelch-repeat protein [Glycine max]|eukprot:XP_006601442.1 F-box/kelch-repeat protein At3g23880 [Glycine max]
MAMVVGGLPRAAPVLAEDLSVEILSWLPVKVLIRFKCVSKTWNSLIFHPMLVKLHLERSSKNTHTLLKFIDIKCENYYAYPWGAFCSIRSLLENPSSTIDDGCHYFKKDCYFYVGSCNGLVCLHDYSSDEQWVRFWNPATRIMSEDSPHLRLHSGCYNAGPNSVEWFLGFGYDDWSDTYKVVVILSNTKTHEMEVSVHCMGDTDTCWRNILTCPWFLILGQVGRFVSGSINWITCGSTVNGFLVFSCDLKNETCRYLSAPDAPFEIPIALPSLGVLKGCLCASFNQKSHFVVWIMREFGVETSWTQLLNVSYQHLQLNPIHGYINITILYVSEDEDVFFLASHQDAEFILYDQRNNRISRTGDFNNCHKSSASSYDYVPSLVLPY